MFFAHISDLHIGDPTKDGIAHLEKVINQINAFPCQAEFVLVTGDVVHGKAEKDYQTAFSLLNELKAPYFVITGNKDGTENLIKAINKYYPQHPQPQANLGLQYVVDDFALRIIAVDTYAEGKCNGELSAERLLWLEKVLEDNPQHKPCIVMVHQFPFQSGLKSFDKVSAVWYGSFRKLIEKYQQDVKLVACGHLHNPVSGQIASVPVVVAPSTNWLAKYDFEKVDNIVADVRPVGFYLYQWENQNLIQYLVPTLK